MKTRLLIKKTVSALLLSAVMASFLTLTDISVLAAGTKADTAEALQDAIHKAEMTAIKLTLTADITADKSIVIGSGQDITIDLDGHTLGRSLAAAETNGSVITVEGGTLTVNDSSAEHTGCITGGVSNSFGGGIYCVKKDKLPAALTLNGITLKANKAASGGGLYADSGCIVTAENCIFEGNSAEKGGAVTGIGTVTLTNCTVKDNKAAYYGGGVYAASKKAVTIQGHSVFSGNSSGTDGGAVLNAGTLLLKKSSLSDNHAKYGGGIYHTGTLTVTDTQITANNCTENGGGLYRRSFQA